MERLTMRYDTHVAVVCENCDKHLECNGGVICGEVLRNRLAAYEDTGLGPEEVTAIKHALMGRETAKITEFDGIPVKRLRELAQAEKDGRLVVLPCRLKDTVYITEAVYDRGKFSGERVVSAQIDHVTIGGTTGMPVFDLCTETGGWYYSMNPNQFYLTREEAEAALKMREEEDNEAD